ncbi:MAG: DUF924 family protein [Pseudomonadota bacterium]
MQENDAASVLRFWFEDCAPEQWFKKDAAFDDALATRFGALMEAALSDPALAARWAETARGRLAVILLLDQFPRNVQRGAAKAFAGDAAALALSQAAEPAGHLADLTLDERKFMLMPMMHSEALTVQSASLALFARYCDAETLGYAKAHHDVIVRFGRFPHRNAALKRESTAAERAYLAEPGAGF